MSQVRSRISISVDGFVAGPDQSLDNPIGVGGLQLHQWQFQTAAFHAMVGKEGGSRSADSEIVEQSFQGVGAYIMGRNMFGPGRGAWDQSWRGWWGADPPFHTPVFVLTHHPREPLQMGGGTRFEFVTDGIESALDRARAAAGDGDVVIAGGAGTLQQYIAAGLLQELLLHVVPVVLGSGERLFDGVGHPKLEPVEVTDSPTVTHIRYRLT